MARIVRMHAVGAAEVLRLDEVDVDPPGAGEVLIRVAAIGLNRVESLFRSGGFGAPALPSKIGYEAAGVIETTGEGVSEFHAGDRVATLPGLSMEAYGVYGELALYPADMLVRLPDGQPMTEAAATWMQYLTAYGLIAIAKIKPGDAVIITAASSSVGLAAIQIVNAEGGLPIAVTRGRGKAQALLAHGAAHVVVSDEQDLAQSVLEITGGQGAAIAFDAVGGAAFASLPLAMAHGGMIMLYGSLGGDVTSFPASLTMLRGVTIRGFAMNDMLADPVHRRNAIAYINAGLASGKLRPVIDRTFDLAEIVEAHRHLESNVQFGKIVVTVDRSAPPAIVR
jgi:NADPH:quinone reductase-like Zn-dependent oxidoreductase